MNTKSPLEVRKSRKLNQLKFWGPLGVTQSGGSRYEGSHKMPKPTSILFEMVYVMTEEEAVAALMALRGNDNG